jgi:hypothetical protein
MACISTTAKTLVTKLPNTQSLGPVYSTLIHNPLRAFPIIPGSLQTNDCFDLLYRPLLKELPNVMLPPPGGITWIELKENRVELIWKQGGFGVYLATGKEKTHIRGLICRSGDYRFKIIARETIFVPSQDVGKDHAPELSR